MLTDTQVHMYTCPGAHTSVLGDVGAGSTDKGPGGRLLTSAQAFARQPCRADIPHRASGAQAVSAAEHSQPERPGPAVSPGPHFLHTVRGPNPIGGTVTERAGPASRTRPHWESHRAKAPGVQQPPQP